MLSGWCRIIVILPQMRWSEISVKLQICAGATNLNHRAESDIRLACLRKNAPAWRTFMKKRWKRILSALAAFIFLSFCYARYVEPNLLVVKEIAVETDKDMEECKIVFFTDTHFGSLYDEGHAGEIADKINELEADIVVFGGDLFDNYTRDREMLDLEYLQKELGRIYAKSGKYAVFGNHDYGGGASRIYREFMEECGFCVLVNESAFLEEYGIEIVGFDDYLLGGTEPDSYLLQSENFHLIITHEPAGSKIVEGSGGNLILSGHTHGGQVSIPYFTRKRLPAGSDQFVKGFYKEPVPVYVSSGIGLTRYPFRMFNIPEIIEIRILARNI